MPVFNGQETLKIAIPSLRSQTFCDWILLISDNCSTDCSFEIATAHSIEDPRIKCYRHEANQGAVGNFQFLFHALPETEYFAFAASDDEWEPKFLETCIRNLDRNPSISLATTGVCNISPSGSVVRTHSRLFKLNARNSTMRAARFALQAERHGKANLFYGVIRRSGFSQKSLENLSRSDHFFDDVLFVTQVTGGHRFLIDHETLFRKRLSAAEMASFERRATSIKTHDLLTHVHNCLKFSRFSLESCLLFSSDVRWVAWIVFPLRIFQYWIVTLLRFFVKRCFHRQ